MADSWVSRFGAWLATLVLAPIIVGVVLWRVQMPKASPPEAPQHPILKIMSLSSLPHNVVMGDRLTVTITVDNEGTSVAHQCRGFLHLTNKPTNVDTQVSSAEFGLAPGERRDVAVSFSAPEIPDLETIVVSPTINCHEGEVEGRDLLFRTGPGIFKP